MNPTHSRPLYRYAPIRTIAQLARALSVNGNELSTLAASADGLYRAMPPMPKPDGTFRQTFDAFPRLKLVHTRIKLRFLDHIEYPAYLHGSLKGRSPRTNAAQHRRARVVISEDITKCFPSTHQDCIYDVWRNLFFFSHEVAACLTKLTTRYGALAEGAQTSPQLANLAMWRREPAVYERFRESGLTYSRYVDDIAVSSSLYLDRVEKAKIVTVIYGLLARSGYKPKRDKHDISSGAGRMLVTKLLVNNGPSLLPDERRRVRTAVFQLEAKVRAGVVAAEVAAELNSVLGRVHRLRTFHRAVGQKLLLRVLRLRDEAGC